MRLDNFINFNEAKKVKDDLLEDVSNVFAYLIDERHVSISKISNNNIKVTVPYVEIISLTNEYEFDRYEKSVVDWSEIIQDIGVAIKQLKMMDSSISLKMDTKKDTIGSYIILNIFKETNIMFKENSANINVSRSVFLKNLEIPEGINIRDVLLSDGSITVYFSGDCDKEIFDNMVKQLNKIFDKYGHVKTNSSGIYRTELMGFWITVTCDVVQKYSDGTNRKFRGEDLKKNFKMVI